MPDQKCAACGAPIEPGQNFCPNCGASTAAFTENEPLQLPPRTIQELQRFCAINEMPLAKMRFFIGQNYKEARAFGIYQDVDHFVVYKNKADGSRAVRYNGPDEAYAVQELYAKLLDECHNRGIYPDGPSGVSPEDNTRRFNPVRLFAILCVLIPVIVAVVLFIGGVFSNDHDGYYRTGDDMYYLYDSDWYYYSMDLLDWIAVNTFPYNDYQDYYLGQSYESDWNVRDFSHSTAWSEIQQSRSSTSSSDYDNWDSSDTDWSSDW